MKYILTWCIITSYYNNDTRFPLEDCYHNLELNSYKSACEWYSNYLYLEKDVSNVKLYKAEIIDSIQLINKYNNLKNTKDTSNIINIKRIR